MTFPIVSVLRCRSLVNRPTSSLLLSISGDVHPYPEPTSTADDLNSSFLSYSYSDLINSGLSVVHFNIQSLRSKLELIEVELQNYDILIFSETLLSPEISSENIKIANFSQPFRCDRVGRPGGGVAIYVRDEHSNSIIDVFIVKHAHNVISSFVSDPITPALTRYHSPIVCVLKFTKLKTSNYKRHIWLSDKSNYGEFRNNLQATNWETILNSNTIDQTASIKNLTNKHTNAILPTLVENDLTALTDEEKTEILNKYFCKQSTLPDENTQTLPHERNATPDLSDVVISPQDVLDAITSIDPSKACGPDLVSPRLIREGAPVLAMPLSI
ncbi:hypothetical protein MAR_032966 [Mya arenaria]|uniref:Endonuclease/exonuclease/phosphatase domain-containing protein n=1 Tax=Mya arenaria TaxID=6604 RepID=A0ABY7GAE9_MYAAR|nr:hypothetical protein MAR_032966 [Mya arenaria]